LELLYFVLIPKIPFVLTRIVYTCIDKEYEWNIIMLCKYCLGFLRSRGSDPLKANRGRLVTNPSNPISKLTCSVLQAFLAPNNSIHALLIHILAPKLFTILIL